MSRLVVSIGNGLRKKPAIVLIVFLVWCALFLVALRLSWEDYLTSVLGYQAIYTNKTSADVAWFVGALPQLLQVAFGFVALEKRSQGALAISLIAFLFDVVTDVVYKTAGLPTYSIPIATIESVVLFTLGSEFLLIASFQNIVEYAGDASRAALLLGRSILGSILGNSHDDSLQ